MKIRVLHYFVRFITDPPGGSEELADDEKGVWSGFWFVFIFCTAYSIVAFIFHVLGHKPVAEPFLTVPLDKWYLVQTFTTIPVGYAGFLAYAGLAYLLAKAMGGRGSFDATFGSESYAMFIPTLILMWVPEAFYAPFLIARGITRLPWPGWVETLRVFVVPQAWIVFLSVIALTKIHRIHWIKSFCVVLISSIPMGLVMAAFIR